MIAPAKRPLSSMSPTIVSREGKPYMLIGAAGGSRIITVVALCIMNVVDYGMSIEDAIDAPRFHQQWQPEDHQRRALRFQRRNAGRVDRDGSLLRVASPGGRAAGILIDAPSAEAAQALRLHGAVDSRLETGLAAGY